MKPKTVFLLLALLCGLLYFTRLGSVAFYEEDEPRFAAAAREMVQTGDYLTPRFNGKLRINKPILFYWLASASDSVLGINELGARFPSALLGMATVLLLFLFACRYGSTRFAALAGVALATCLQLSVLARAATADMGLIFFLTAALLAFFRGYTSENSKRYYLLFWACLALATLAKGPAAIVLAVGILGLFLLLRGSLLATIRRLCTPAGLLLFALIAVPWYAYELVHLGQTFFRGFFLAEHFGRFSGNIDPHHGPAWYFLAVFLVLFYPWSCFVPAGMAGAVRELRRENPLRLFAFCWLVVVLGIFSCSGTKLPHYIAPLYPAAALLAAAAWEDRLQGKQTFTWRISTGLLAVVGGALSLGFVALIFYGPKLLAPLAGGTPQPVGPGPALLAVLFAGGWAGSLALLRRDRPGRAAALLGGTLAAAILCLHLILAPVIARHWQEPIRDLAVEAAARAGSRGQLATFACATSGVVYYSERTVAWVRREQVRQLEEMARRAPLFIITTTRRASEVPPALGLRELQQRGGYVLLGPGEEAPR